MNSELIVHKIESHSPEWHAFRLNGLGGSEVSIILGFDEYKSPLRLFYEKIGLADPRIEENEALFWGREEEASIAEKWQYHSGEKLSYIHNFIAGKIIRRAHRMNGIIQNPAMPWLYVSPDRIANKGQHKLNGEPLESEFVLEIKQIAGYVQAKWELGCPPSYAIQVQTYMTVLGLPYGEICIRTDGRYLKILDIEYSEVLATEILESTKDFWYNRVVPGRELVARLELASSEAEKEGLWAQLHKLEPPPTGQESYKDFLSESHTKEKEEMEGGEQHVILAKQAKELGFMIKQLELEKSRIEQILTKDMWENHCEYIKLGNFGYLRFFKKAGNKNFQFDNRVKCTIDEVALQELCTEICQVITKQCQQI